jgi:hypothetical protein
VITERLTCTAGRFYPSVAAWEADLRNCVGEPPTIRLNARLKSQHEGGVDESLPSQIRGLLSHRNAPMPEKRTAVFCNFMLREVKRAAFRQC